jgi:tetratricopeptide (TPR) repeat protein
MPSTDSNPSPKKGWQWSSKSAHLSIAIISLGIWTLTGQLSLWRSVLVIGLSISCFTIGCLAGFLLTSYGEETVTVGRVREWLVGGLTGLTIANVQVIREILRTFAYGPEPREFAVTICLAITYVGLGFFYMFFQRELILNVLLAKSRALRGRLDGTKQAGIATQKLLTGLPPRMLARIDSLDDVIEERKSEFEELRQVLYKEEVSTFLEEADEEVNSAAGVDWDVTSRAAYLHYYRIYYESDEKRELQEDKAEEWILRALFMNPQHGDLTARYADVLVKKESYTDAVLTLERLLQSTEAPAFVQQWLGWVLTFVPNREDDAIRISEDYHRRFPDESDTFFNIACAYAQKYGRELNEHGSNEIPNSENRRLALLNLRLGLKDQPDFAKTVREDWIKPDESFYELANDSEFLQLVGSVEKLSSSSN